jgi:hypothetical protein
MRSSRASSRADFLVSAKLPSAIISEGMSEHTTWRRCLGYRGPRGQLEDICGDRHTDCAWLSAYTRVKVASTDLSSSTIDTTSSLGGVSLHIRSDRSRDDYTYTHERVLV